MQEAWTEPGLRLDLRYEFIDQDQPRHGSNKVGVGELSQHHDEVRTINRNWLATLDYALHKSRDKGSDAEPADSGGKFLFVSPGLSFVLNKSAPIYGFAQLPLYQYVNGVQLTAGWAAVIGVSMRF